MWNSSYWQGTTTSFFAIVMYSVLVWEMYVCSGESFFFFQSPCLPVLGDINLTLLKYMYMLYIHF